MELSCPQCRTHFHLDDAETPRRRLRLRCAACSTTFTVDLREGARDLSERDQATGEQRWALRLARTLASDILIYNRSRRDRALAEGRLLEEFSDELSEAWEIFREEADDGRFTHLFRHAVNTVLADGRPLL